jgi:hypothetical protein
VDSLLEGSLVVCAEAVVGADSSFFSPSLPGLEPSSSAIYVRAVVCHFQRLSTISKGGERVVLLTRAENVEGYERGNYYRMPRLGMESLIVALESFNPRAIENRSANAALMIEIERRQL